MENFKRIVADNIIRLRLSAGMTQAQLGEKLNYSDKSISKWERAESLPDAFVLKNIGELFNVTVDFLLTQHDNSELVMNEISNQPHRYSTKVISMIAFFGVWAVAILVFVILWLMGNIEWLTFVYTIPISLVVLLVMNSIWGIGKVNLYIISGILWTVLATIYLTVLEKNWWQLFLIGIPVQIIVVLCFYVKKNKAKGK